MNLTERIDALVQLGQQLSNDINILQDAIKLSYHENRWFIEDNSKKAITAIANNFLQKDRLDHWLTQYSIVNVSTQKKIGLILAGNIPLVGFHDVLSVFISGHISVIKLSDKDKQLLPAILKLLYKIDPRTDPYFEIVERLTEYDAVIATGSDNSAVHFEYYFKHVPHIIRRNRNAVAILSGDESREEIVSLGKDIFNYFGLGCRNVSKLYIPEGYNLEFIMEALHDYNELVLHNKYKNNFDYNYAIYLLNQDKFLMNGCILLMESEDIASRIAMLGYEYYSSNNQLIELLNKRKGEIQCIVSNRIIQGLQTVGFSHAQEPSLTDYADGVDTLEFLIEL